MKRLDRKPSRAVAPSFASLCLALALWACPAAAHFTGGPPFGESVCGPVASGGFGPFDIRKISPSDRHLVEMAHFTPQVEALIRGKGGTIGGDLDYTLRAIPNHSRALSSMARFAERHKTDPPPGARSRIECYFDRALRLAPDDGRVYAVYADWLRRKGRRDEARLALELVEKHAGDDAQLRYNAGLVWLDLGEPDRALQMARIAYAAGVPFEALKTRLKEIGRWSE